MSSENARNALKHLNRKVHLIEMMRTPLRELAEWSQCSRLEADAKRAELAGERVITMLKTRGDEIPSEAQLGNAERLFSEFLEKFAAVKAAARSSKEEGCCAH